MSEQLMDRPALPEKRDRECVDASAGIGVERERGDKPEITSSDDPLRGGWVRRIAEELHTDVYLKMGYITEGDLDPDGVYRDEYSHRATYLVSEGRNRLSACRYIPTVEHEGLTSLPTVRNFVVDTDMIEAAAGVTSLEHLRHDEVIEVSGLVSVALATGYGQREREYDATQSMYAQILRVSVEQGHKLWLLNTQPKLIRAFAGLVGHEQLILLGPPQPYMHIETYPATINPQRVIAATLHDPSPYGEMKRAYLRQAFDGIDPQTSMSDELRVFLRSNNT